MKNIFRFAAAFVLTALLSAGLSATAFGTQDTNGRLNLTEGTIGDGVSMRGESLTGRLPNEVKPEIYKPMETLMDSEVRMKSDKNPEHVWGTTIPSLGIQWDKQTIEDTINASIVPGGRVLDRYKFAADCRANPVDLDYGIEIDEAKILNTFTEKLEPWNCEPIEAQFTARVGTPTEYSQMGASRQVIVTPGQTGYSYDFTNCVHELVENIKAVKIADTDLIELTPDVTETIPNMTTEHAESMSVIGYFTTEYAIPRTQQLINREQNLKMGIIHMDGRVFAPGEQISALNLYGDVMDPNNGYARAGTYTTSGHGDEMGGGLCQVTTTLYNAVLEAELKIVYRHQHSYLINYVPPGLDAMVYPQGGSDFIFENDSSDIIKIEGCIDLATEFIHIWIIGHEDHDPGRSVRYESVVEGIDRAPVTRVEDPSFGIGWTGQKFSVSVDPQNGAHAHVIKHIYQDGVEIAQENIHGTDIYKTMPGTINMAPDVNVDAVVTGDLLGYYTSLSTTFLDGTSIGSNPVFWTVEERDAFDARMTALLAEKGYEWPRRGGWEFKEGEDETEPSSEDESESGSDVPAEDAPTEAPATDAPATDAPATDAPATDAPATDAPAE